MKVLCVATLLGLALSLPAAGQPKAPTGNTPAKTEADCPANWKSADKNSDGRLDASEVTAAKAMIPTTIASQTTINEQEFLAACRTSVQGQKK